MRHCVVLGSSCTAGWSSSLVYCHCHTLLPSACVLHVGVPTLLNSASSSFTWLRPPQSTFTFAAVFLLTWPRASWSAGTPRLRRVVYTSGGAKLLSFMPPSLLAPFHRLPLCTLFSRCALHLALRLWTDVRVFLLFTFVRPAFEVWTESAPWTASHLLWLLILLHLLDRQDMSLHDPESSRNLHDFLQAGCSTHLRLHFRIVRACIW